MIQSTAFPVKSSKFYCFKCPKKKRNSKFLSIMLRFSSTGWVKIAGAASAVIKATLTTDNTTFKCLGTVIAKSGCWSFLKGGFVLDSPSTYAHIYFQV